MNILILNSGRKWIGEVAHTFQLATGLARRGRRVVTGARAGTVLAERLRACGEACAELEAVDLHFHSRFRPLAELADVGQLRRLIAEREIDLVLVNRGKDHWLAALALRTLGKAAKARRRPPVVRVRHVVTPARRHSFNRWLFNRATDALVGVSEKTLDSVRPVLRRDRGASLHCILSAVDHETFSPARRSAEWRARQGAGPDDLLIGLIGRFQRIKGQDLFLRAAAQFADAYPRARFLLTGAGGAHKAERYRALAREGGFDERLSILGPLDDLPEAMASLDIGVAASRGSEGSSRVCLEYMASGLPLVATRVGGIPELIEDEVQGLLVEPKAPEQIADALKRLLDDAELRARLGGAGRRRVVERHGPDRWLDDFERVFRETIERRGGPENDSER